MTCVARVRRIAAEPGPAQPRTCCTRLRRVLPYQYQPETEEFLENEDSLILDDDTIYYNGTAFEITGNEIWLAVDNFYVAVKNALGLTLGVNNLSTFFKFIYLFIGGTATAHAVNSIDVPNFNIDWFGGLTHSGGGVDFGGVNGYGDTNCPMGELLPAPQNFDGLDMAFGVYSRTNQTGLYCALFGADGVNSEIYLYPRFGAGNLLTRNGTTGTNFQNATADSLAHLSMSRVNNTEYKTYKRGNLLATNTQPSTTHCAEINILIGAIGGPSQFLDGELSCVWGGKGMTPAQMSDFDDALQALQVSLNRAV